MIAAPIRPRTPSVTGTAQPSGPGTFPHRTPLGRSSFEGRRDELDDLRRRFDEGARLVCVVGPPGIGKTRLAEQHVLRLEERPPPPGLVAPAFCDLRGCRNEAALVGELGRRLDVRVAEATPSPAVALGERMAAHPPRLVVLDNFEQLIPGGLGVLSEWLTLAPRVQFLVTSRRVVRLQGVELLELGPLSMPEVTDRAGSPNDESCDATRLFWNRARAAEPSIREDEASTRCAADLVRDLEGNPLAIELVAAQTRRFSVRELAQRVRGKVLALSSPLHDVAPHHATLVRAIDESWNLLTPDEQDVLAQLSVFENGFGLDAAEAVVTLGPHSSTLVADAVVSVREASLLTATDVSGRRRWDLYETVREYARAKLEAAGNPTAARERHARFYLRWGERVLYGQTENGIEASPRFASELDNLRVAFLHVAERGLEDTPLYLRMAFVYHQALAPWLPRTADDVATQALDATRGMAPSNHRVRLLVARAATQREIEGYAGIEPNLEEAERHFAFLCGEGRLQPEERQRLAGELRYEVGMLDLYHGRAAAARTNFEAALDAVRTIAAHRVEGRTHTALAHVLAESFRDPAAFEHHDQAIALMAQVGDARGELTARIHRSVHCTFFRRHDEADEFEHGLGGVQAAAGPVEDAYLSIAAALFYIDRGKMLEAAERCEHALSLAERLGLGRVRGLACLNLATIRQLQGNLDEAASVLEQAATTFTKAGHQKLEALACILGAGLAAMRDDLDQARDGFERAEALLDREDDRHYRDLAELQQSQLDLAEARAALQGAQFSRAQRLRHQAAERLVAARAPRTHEGHPLLALPECCLEARSLLDLIAAQMSDSSCSVGTLRVAESAAWFAFGAGQQKPVADGAVIRRVLRALVKQRQDHPGTALSTHAIIERCWPGERLVASSGVRRVRDLVKRLRRTGLHDALMTGERGGYFLDPRFEVRVVVDGDGLDGEHLPNL